MRFWYATSGDRFSPPCALLPWHADCVHPRFSKMTFWIAANVLLNDVTPSAHWVAAHDPLSPGAAITRSWFVSAASMQCVNVGHALNLSVPRCPAHFAE